jgi:hypothetical protein
MHITGAVNRAHSPNTDHFLNQITFGKRDTRLKLARRRGTLITLII